MCIVCGNLIGEPHWTERRLEAGAAGGGDGETRRRQDRRRRIQLVNRVLAHRHLAVHDEWSATRYQLSNGRGSTELLDDLGAIWPAVERLLGEPLDPLDEAVLQSLA